MVNPVRTNQMVKMIKPAGHSICTRGENGKADKCDKMARFWERESEINLPTPQYRWANLWTYRSTNQAIALEM